VSDLITGIYKIAILDKPLETPINLGNPAEYSIKTLAELIIKLSESNSSLVNKQLPQDDPKQRKPDVTLAEKLIKWSPNVSLTQGLKTTIDYFISIK
jgi:UDP-glucuronate decarboxylase